MVIYRSNCLRVGLSKPSTHSFTLGCCSRYAQQSFPERSIAQARMDLSMFNLTRLITITYIFTPANIRLSFENAKRFLEYFFDGPTRISQICTDFVVASNGDSHLVSMEKLRRSRRFVRFERFVFKNQPAHELLIGVTEHELHELHEYVA